MILARHEQAFIVTASRLPLSSRRDDQKWKLWSISRRNGRSGAFGLAGRRRRGVTMRTHEPKAELLVEGRAGIARSNPEVSS